MRASRLVSVLLLLQARGRMTAEALAEELEVSPRTIYRDIDDLSAAGVPVYGERGKGGGFRLLDGYRTNLTGLTTEEAGALLLSGAPGPAAELGLGSLLATTRLKLLAAVPPGLREAAMRAEQRFHLDPRDWAHDRLRDDRWLRPIAQAVWNDRRVHISYRRPDGRVVERLIDPVGLVHKTGSWYLVAWHEGSARVYRVDRVQSAQESGETAQRPPDFDLASFWERWETDYAATLPAFSTRVRLGPLAQRHRDNLGPLSPRAVTEHGIAANDWVEQSLLFDTRRIAVSALLALAPEVEIDEPAELRDDLVAIAREMIERTLNMGGSSPSAGERRISRPDLRPYLGKRVTVDRPLGSQHPAHTELRYPVNYGFLVNTVSGDGAPIDAYVLGIEEPVGEIDGVVIGLVLRADDVEDKLVVAPPGQRFSAAEIRAAVEFQEQFFESQIVVACNAVQIVTLTPEDWRLLKTIRLEALRAEPAAFSSSYENALSRSDHEWHAHLANPQRVVLIARVSEQPIGMVGAYRGVDDDPSLAIVFGMYVNREHRRQGVGRLLLASLIDLLSELREIATIRLWVTEEQESARILYESVGFQVVSRESQNLQGDGRLRDELVMERTLLS